MSTPADTTRWPVRIELPVQWGEMDALGHVNNIVYLRWFESARMDYFRRCGVLDGIETEGVGPILAGTKVDFKIPLAFPDTVTVVARVTRAGNSSFTMQYRVTSAAAQGAIAAEGEGVIVMVRYAEGKPVSIPPAIRDAIAELERPTS